MNGVQGALRSLKASWVLFAALVSALIAHALIAWLQTDHTLSGDYVKHPHGSLPAVALFAVCASAIAAMGYMAGIVRQASPSLPLLARALRRAARWQMAIAIIVTASLTLVSMEMAEQAAARQLDGPMSAFGDRWLFGLVALIVVAVCMLAMGRALCAWLIEAHRQVLGVALSLLSAGSPAEASFERLGFPTTKTCYHRLGATNLGARAPPLLPAR